MMAEFQKLLKMGKRPKALDERPVLKPHLEFYLSAFWELCSDRGGEGFGPILYSSISQYARDHGLASPSDFEPFKRMIRAADRVWLKDVMKRREREQRDAEARAKAWGR